MDDTTDLTQMIHRAAMIMHRTRGGLGVAWESDYAAAGALADAGMLRGESDVAPSPDGGTPPQP